MHLPPARIHGPASVPTGSPTGHRDICFRTPSPRVRRHTCPAGTATSHPSRLTLSYAPTRWPADNPPAGNCHLPPIHPPAPSLRPHPSTRLPLPYAPTHRLDGTCPQSYRRPVAVALASAYPLTRVALSAPVRPPRAPLAARTPGSATRTPGPTTPTPGPTTPTPCWPHPLTIWQFRQPPQLDNCIGATSSEQYRLPEIGMIQN
ncbi:hypothetical protein Ade02nite_27740 [Paractinoplanes deccanensis]|uniref:Uncharacterized protein n=1 Tax=Paractinoplanes deccanensis TaxID=113561 RepID=A0ABQ3Y2D5_9ACTN|nr:hypothetical protein Ade02nite_27740 [Actinoplanes deccanensis]